MVIWMLFLIIIFGKNLYKISWFLCFQLLPFVTIVQKYPYDIDLKHGKYVVDAKSILGIFSLDLSKPVTLEIHSDNCDDLLQELKPFAC